MGGSKISGLPPATLLELVLGTIEFEITINSSTSPASRRGSGTQVQQAMQGGVSYTWPAAHGAASTVLTDNGAGVLSWATPSIGNLSGDVTSSGLVTSYAGNLPVAKLGSGTGATSSTFWRGDGSWAVPTVAPGNLTGDVTSVGLATTYNSNLPVSKLNSGTSASASTYWRGDGTWATIAAGGNVSNSGTPTIGQAAEWMDAVSIKGVAVTGSGSYVKGTAPTIAGGSITALTALAIRSTGAAFDLTVASSEVLTAGRTLSLVLGDAARTLTIGASASVSGSNTGDQTTVSGNAGTATTLQTARNINGVSFNGSANIDLTSAASWTVSGPMTIQEALEKITISATAATGTINYDALTQGILYYTTNASANWTLNLRGSSGASLDSSMATGQCITLTFMVTQGATPYYNNVVTIDGGANTPKWLGGTAPAAGNASGIDIYTYAIVKTGSATFTVIASQTQAK